MLALGAGAACSGSCGKSGAEGDSIPRATESASAVPPPKPAGSAGAPRAGMAWVPPGTLKAGTAPGATPRIAEEELPGSNVELKGFYIDLLPWPNEHGAIPTTNVSRDDAQALCEQKGKRLCTELEWERACKGEQNTTYEYGADYKAATCGTGIPIEEAARRPTGDRPACKSAFGVLEMHGGAWEWTSSRWGRGSKEELGVLRGGNAALGELVGRCANGLARPPKQKSATMGFRCCAGPKNDAEVDLAQSTGPALVGITKTEALREVAALSGAPAAKVTASTWVAGAGWRWRPVANETLLVVSGCTWAPAPAQGSCAFGVLREPDRSVVIAAPTDRMIVDVALAGDRRKLRAVGFDSIGSYVRDLTYAVGVVDLGELRRH